MPFPSAPRLCSVLVSVLAATGLVLTAAGCAGHITPLGPEPTPAAMPAGATVVGPPHRILLRQLGAPIVLQVMHSEPATPAGGCPAESVAVSVPPGAAPMGCFRAVGKPVTIISAAVSPVFMVRPASPPGQPAQPPAYGLTVSVTAAQIAAVTALIQQAYDSHDALGISVGGTLWQAPGVDQPFSGQQLQVAFSSKDQALQLYRILIPSS